MEEFETKVKPVAKKRAQLSKQMRNKPKGKKLT
jgi:hypothetical protein